EPRLVLSSAGLVHEVDWLGSSSEAYQGHWILGLSGWNGGLIEQQTALEQQLQSLGLADQIAVDTHLGSAGLFRIDTSPMWGYEDVYQSVSLLTGFSYVEPDFVLEIENTPNDPEFNDLWGLH